MKNLFLLGAIVLSVSSFAQIVNIPDANFKAFLVGNTSINTNADTEIQVSEANAFAGAIVCSAKNISDLTGIEEFTALTHLDCSLNHLTTFDISNNTALAVLVCEDAQLTALDVSNNTALISLSCLNNQLTTLDVSNNTALVSLYCYNNQLTALDVSSNTDLVTLWCNNNQLTCLNVKNGNNSNFYHFGADNNPSLTCIEVDDVSYSNAYWFNIDTQTSFSTDCSNSCSGTLGIKELTQGKAELVKITDLMGRETKFKPNTPLVYYYSNGTIERMFKSE